MIKLKFISTSLILSSIILSFLIGYQMNSNSLKAQLRKIESVSSPLMNDCQKNHICVIASLSDSAQISTIEINPTGRAKFSETISFNTKLTITNGHISRLTTTKPKITPFK